MDSCNLAAAEAEKAAQKSDQKSTDPSSYSYEGENVLVYTDSATGFQYKWDVTENKWIPKESSVVSEGPKAVSSDQPTADHKYEIVGNTYMYKDEKTGRTLVWDLEMKQWKPKADADAGEPVRKKKKKRGSDEEFNTSDESEDEEVLEQRKQDMNFHVFTREDGVKYYTDPADGTVYEWDVEKRAWFPNLDEEFLARYQMSYGVDPSAPLPPIESAAPPARAEPKPKKSDKDKQPPAEPSWFQVEDTHNTKVYVSGLPTDITEKEFIDFMQKCGLVEKDLQTDQMKIKLYKDANGQMKGDALCTYIRVFY